MADLETMPTKQGLVAAIRSRYETRVHMSLIVGGSIAVALMVTRSLHALGVDTLLFRYTAALAAAYGAFFVGVWLWLRLSRYGRYLSAVGRKSALRDAGDALSNSGGGSWSGGSGGGSGGASGGSSILRGGGGGFDGGGANASWASGAGNMRMALPAGVAGGDDGGATHAIGEGAGKALGGVADAVGGDNDGLFIVALVLVVVALCALLGAAGFVVYQAPAILGDVVFNVMLASSMVKHAKNVHPERWQRALLRRTWIPFAAVALAALAFALFAHRYAPQATTAREVFLALAR